MTHDYCHHQRTHLANSAGLSCMCSMVSLLYTTSKESSGKSRLVQSLISNDTCRGGAGGTWREGERMEAAGHA